MDIEFTTAMEEEILHRRAKALSIVPAVENGSEKNSLLVVKFLLAKELYGIETLFIQEVLPLKELTLVPGTPAFIMGVINVRGKIFPVLDPKKIFNLPEHGITEFNKVILINYEDIRFGLVTDEIRGTEIIPISALNPAPYTLSGIGTEFIQGITVEGLIILQTGTLIKSKHIIVNQ